MRINLLLPAAILLVLGFQACNKVSESFQRDIIIKPDSILLNIPIIPTTINVVKSADLPILLDLPKEIKNGAPDFEVKDIRNFRIVTFRIDILADSIDIKNNFGNIQETKLLATTGSKVDTVARYTNPSNAVSGSVILNPLISGNALRDLMTNSATKFNVQFKARTETTVALKSKVTSVYTLTLSK